MIAAVFLSIGLAATAVGCAGLFCGWGARRFHGCMAIADGSLAVFNALAGERLPTCVASALCAYAAWRWWHSGGGDGAKRRLKAWARKFTGVRRTAPVAGAA